MRALAVVVLVGLGLSVAGAAEPVDGTWRLAGRVTATACAARCATKSARIDEPIVVTGGQLSGGEGLVPACNAGVSETEFDGLSTLVPAGRGWQRIRILDRSRFLALMRRCFGYGSLRLARVAARVKVAPDGLRFRERAFVSGNVVVYDQTVTFSASGRIRAAWTGAAGVPLGSARAAAFARAVDRMLAGE